MGDTPIEIDIAAVEKAKASEAFSDRCWLTFYLVGSIDAHQAMRSALLELGGENLGNDDFAWVYAKLPVTLDFDEIEDRVARVQRLCARTGVTIDLIDLDSSVDADTTKFVTLWQP